jgi:hypothetical protein
MRTKKIGAGFYRLGAYIIAKTPDGWRWYLETDASVGGGWRRTKKDALYDLLDYLGPTEPEKDMDGCWFHAPEK